MSVLVRMLLAFLCGALIGMEREFKRRAAGFRTHILICLGSAITTLTGEYLFLNLHYYTDITRIGAQVIAGIGFIGAGTIIVTRRRRIKGLTTAAGLWTSAIIGLAIGAGFYEVGIYATIIVLIMELVFSRLEYQMLRSAREFNIYVEYSNSITLDNLLQELRGFEVQISGLEIVRSAKETSHSKNIGAVMTLHTSKHMSHEQLIREINEIPGLLFVEEL